MHPSMTSTIAFSIQFSPYADVAAEMPSPIPANGGVQPDQCPHSEICQCAECPGCKNLIYVWKTEQCAACYMDHPAIVQ
ncbi:hypothetical protein HZS61_010936 [Fusarium oxysporum f. sp. conglutinans]|uniref:Uncharacterized protein n=2 Tax=Fusarium oxysporum f. sp. conglutinans TaxID=100902 RepID=A0A8H6GWW1_FUSOX|nr:hypothetical protein FOXB_00017 [Fusarium oxysporum f. sp. conglutinans Fo5176]KAF6525141.1 hypothetical protein HZS61_010936 [Fusarium oxysporum f. sp. conglutinans]